MLAHLYAYQGCVHLRESDPPPPPLVWFASSVAIGIFVTEKTLEADAGDRASRKKGEESMAKV